MTRMAVLVLLALASGSVQADPELRAGLAASFGQFKGDDVPAPNLGDKFIDDDVVGFKLYGQYQFNDWFGVEGAYHNTNDFDDKSTNENLPGKLALSFSGFSVQGLLYVPTSIEGFQAYLKAGFYDFSDELSLNGSNLSNSSENGLVAGAGGVIRFSDQLGLRVDYDWFDADVGDLSSVNLGVEYYFGARAAAPVAVATAPPPPPAAEPPPPPPPPPPPEPTDSDDDGVNDDTDACPETPAGARVNARGCEEQLVLQGVTFEVNSANLTPNSMLTLDSVAAILKKRPNFNVEIRGHTDSAGADELNLDLSRRRAEAVMSYLVDGGVDADKLAAAGYGETQPVASNDTADGRAQNRRVALEFTEAN